MSLSPQEPNQKYVIQRLWLKRKNIEPCHAKNMVFPIRLINQLMVDSLLIIGILLAFLVPNMAGAAKWNCAACTAVCGFTGPQEVPWSQAEAEKISAPQF